MTRITTTCTSTGACMSPLRAVEIAIEFAGELQGNLWRIQIQFWWHIFIRESQIIKLRSRLLAVSMNLASLGDSTRVARRQEFDVRQSRLNRSKRTHQIILYAYIRSFSKRDNLETAKHLSKIWLLFSYLCLLIHIKTLLIGIARDDTSGKIDFTASKSVESAVESSASKIIINFLLLSYCN